MTATDGWVLRTADRKTHECPTPVGSFGGPTGSLGDLWRCAGCQTLWRIGRACPACEAYGPGRHGGSCRVGTAWLPATTWQRLRHRPAGRRLHRPSAPTVAAVLGVVLFVASMACAALQSFTGWADGVATGWVLFAPAMFLIGWATGRGGHGGHDTKSEVME